jgi:hypothetical protein
MKTFMSLCLAAMLLSACASPTATTAGKAAETKNVYHPKYPLYAQRANEKTGDMSYVVERLAKQGGCELYENAQLMAKRPGVQFYRVPCTDGHQILYRCEMRRCDVAD